MDLNNLSLKKKSLRSKIGAVSAAIVLVSSFELNASEDFMSLVNGTGDGISSGAVYTSVQYKIKSVGSGMLLDNNGNGAGGPGVSALMEPDDGT